MSGAVESAISKAAIKTGVNRAALERVIYNESRGNPAIGMDSKNYSAGIGQISRVVWRKYTSLPYSDAADPAYYETNIEIAAKYLKENYRRYHTWKLAMAAYNEGPGTLNKILKGERDYSPITKKYISGVTN